MTRKHFVIVADMLAALSSFGKLDTSDMTVQAIVDGWLREANGRYQSSRFWSRVNKNK